MLDHLQSPLRFLLIMCFIFFTACSSEADYAEARAKKAKEIEIYQNAYRKKGNINYDCLKAANKFIKNKPEQCTKYRKVVSGSKKTGAFMYCFPPDIYGNQVCDSTSKNEDIVNVVPYQTTCDANWEMRSDFLHACKCKNGYDLMPDLDDEFNVSSEDLKLSKEYLIQKWLERGKQYATTGVEMVTPMYRHGNGKQYPSIIKGKPYIPKHSIEKCNAKNEYYLNQTWYKRIPISNY